MGRSGRLRAALDRDRARLLAATNFLEFLQFVQVQTVPGIAFFDPVTLQTHFSPEPELVTPQSKALVASVDFATSRVASVHVTQGWNTKVITLDEIAQQQSVLQDQIKTLSR